MSDTAPQTRLETHAERRWALASQIGRLTGTIKGAIIALDAGISPAIVAAELRAMLAEVTEGGE